MQRHLVSALCRAIQRQKGTGAPPRNGTIFAGDFPVIRPGTAKLHPKGTSSRFALRAPRPRWGLAMTNWEANAVGEGKRKFAAA